MRDPRFSDGRKYHHSQPASGGITHKNLITGTGAVESQTPLETQTFLQRKTQEDVTKNAADVATTDRSSNKTAGDTSI